MTLLSNGPIFFHGIGSIESHYQMNLFACIELWPYFAHVKLELTVINLLDGPVCSHEIVIHKKQLI